MSALHVWVEGVGAWSPRFGNFAALGTVLDGGASPPVPARPPAATLAPNERRRAPQSVLLAIEVAGQAVVMSGRDAATLACVFASSHGDQAITDYMCATLAQAPAELSPTRFHNSVHNAPVGYWTMATGCHAPSTAVAAQHASFGAGLLEAVSQVRADGNAVLLVCSDIGGSGPLGELTRCPQPFGMALVLAPEPGPCSLAMLDVQLLAEQPHDPLPEPLASWQRESPSAAGLPLLLALHRQHGRCRLALTPGLDVQLETTCRALEATA